MTVAMRRMLSLLPQTATGTGRGERWVSQQLKLVVYSRSEDSEIGVVEYQLTRISRADQRADLFEVPSDYEVAAGKYPLSWQFLKAWLKTQGPPRR